MLINELYFAEALIIDCLASEFQGTSNLENKAIMVAIEYALFELDIGLLFGFNHLLFLVDLGARYGS
jgi:hypothetical protein